MSIVAILLLLVAGGLAHTEGSEEFIRMDPGRVVEPVAESCGQCHRAEFAVWEGTPHARSLDDLHRRDRAREIADAMGFPLVTRNSLCLRCHYTPVARGTGAGRELRAAQGVSCESCHGAARDWINVHYDYGVPGSGRPEGRIRETQEHRAQRIARSTAAGMLRPSELYPVAANCYDCHIIAVEELVNKGGHAIGSPDFELVRWSQGSMRHNFLESTLTGNDTRNAERPPERLRRMYVAGRALELEYSLRALSVTTGDGRYFREMKRRVATARQHVERIAELAPTPEVDEILASVRCVRVDLGNIGPLLQAADLVAAATRRFLANHDGRRLAGLDPLLPGALGDTDATADIANGSGGPFPSGAAAGHATVGADRCEQCHGAQADVWRGGPHSSSADALRSARSAYVELARRYGLDASEMVRGDGICMECHGTVTTGGERSDVSTGVSCESCHGPGAGFLVLHRSDRARALQRGLVDLRDLPTRARTCGVCHVVSDPGLLAAGHPSGSSFDFVAGNRRIRHWKAALPDAELQAAYEGRHGDSDRVARAGEGR